MSYVIGSDDKGTAKKYVQYLDNAVNDGGEIGELQSTLSDKMCSQNASDNGSSHLMFELYTMSSDGNSYLNIRWNDSFSADIVGAVSFNNGTYFIKNTLNPIPISSSIESGITYIYYNTIESSIFSDTELYPYATYVSTPNISQIQSSEIRYEDLYENATPYSVLILIGFYDASTKSIVQALREESVFRIIPFNEPTPCINKNKISIVSNGMYGTRTASEESTNILSISGFPRYVGNFSDPTSETDSDKTYTPSYKYECDSDYKIADVDFYTDSKRLKVIDVSNNGKVALYWNYIGSCRNGKIVINEPSRVASFRNSKIVQDESVVFDFEGSVVSMSGGSYVSPLPETYNVLNPSSVYAPLPAADSIIYMRVANNFNSRIPTVLKNCSTLSKEEYEAYKEERDIVAKKSADIQTHVNSIMCVIDKYMSYISLSNDLLGSIKSSVYAYYSAASDITFIFSSMLEAEELSFSNKKDTISLDRYSYEIEMSLLDKDSETYLEDVDKYLKKIKGTYEEESALIESHKKTLETMNNQFKIDYSAWCTKSNVVCESIINTLNPFNAILREFKNDIQTMLSLVKTKLDEGLSLERELIKLDNIVYGSAIDVSFSPSIISASVDEVLEPTDSYSYIPMAYIHVKDNVYFAEAVSYVGATMNLTLPSIFEK